VTGHPHPALGVETPAPDEAAVTAAFIAFLKAATDRRHPSGPKRRFNQGRATAYLEAEFTVLDRLAPEHRVGLFAEARTYPAFVRFANATSASDRDRDVRGMSIRISGVIGANLTPGATSQDLVLNSHPVMMVPGTREFLELLQANEQGGFRRAMYFLRHPKAAAAALASRSNPTCHLDIPYWSTTPYRFGPGRAVKYIATPTSPVKSPMPDPLTDTYLQDAMRARLTDHEATFDLMVQFQTDARRMPIEDASVEWRREDSPYIAVARLRIPPQRFDTPERVAAGEAAAFNPWHCLPDHQPLGSMNRARREIYSALAAHRGAPAAVRT
jgi:hypothetical protein